MHALPERVGISGEAGGVYRGVPDAERVRGVGSGAYRDPGTPAGWRDDRSRAADARGGADQSALPDRGGVHGGLFGQFAIDGKFLAGLRAGSPAAIGGVLFLRLWAFF